VQSCRRPSSRLARSLHAGAGYAGVPVAADREHGDARHCRGVEEGRHGSARKRTWLASVSAGRARSRTSPTRCRHLTRASRHTTGRRCTRAGQHHVDVRRQLRGYALDRNLHRGLPDQPARRTIRGQPVAAMPHDPAAAFLRGTPTSTGRARTFLFRSLDLRWTCRSDSEQRRLLHAVNRRREHHHLRATNRVQFTRYSTSAAIAGHGCVTRPKAASLEASSARITTGPTVSTAGCSPAPHMAPEFRRDDLSAAPAPHGEVWDGFVFINLAAAHAPTGSNQLADLPVRFAPWQMDQLRLGRRIAYDVKANWKLIVLNYNECLHWPEPAPGAEPSAPLSRRRQCRADTVLLRRRDGIPRRCRDDEHRRQAPARILTGPRRRAAAAGHLFRDLPNLLLSLHPDYVMTHTLWPRAHDRTEIVCEWHFHPAELARADVHIDDAVEFGMSRTARIGGSLNSHSWG